MGDMGKDSSPVPRAQEKKGGRGAARVGKSGGAGEFLSYFSTCLPCLIFAFSRLFVAGEAFR